MARGSRISMVVRCGLAALVLVTAAVVGGALPASAATTCGGSYAHPRTAHMADGYSFSVSRVQNCPIWKSGTPVYGSAYHHSATPVGTLVNAGSGNWFVCHDSSYKDTVTVNGYTSNDWAITLADNGRWGWVPAVYFSGSANYWAGLRTCTTHEDP